MAGNESLRYSKFHNFIETKDSLTVLSAAERGIELDAGKKYGFVTNKEYKSVSIFAESITLCDPDPDNDTVFGSTAAETVILSTTTLHNMSKTSEAAVIIARGADGKTNKSGIQKNRDETNGKPGHTVNLFVGQSPSVLPKVQLDARGGHGGKAEEAGKAPGKGGQGGHARALVLPTWVPIIQDLRKAINSPSGVDSDDEYAQPDQTIVKEPVPETVVGSIAGIIRDICRLCQEDDLLCRKVLGKLKPVCDDSMEVSRTGTLKTLKGIRTRLMNTVEDQSISAKDSVGAPGGSGGSSSRKLGERTSRGEDGIEGQLERLEVQFARRPAGIRSVAPLAMHDAARESGDILLFW